MSENVGKDWSDEVQRRIDEHRETAVDEPYAYDQGHRQACEEMLVALAMIENMWLASSRQAISLSTATQIVASIRDGKPFALDGVKIVEGKDGPE